MKSSQDRFEYYEKTSPKWLTILIPISGIVLVWFFIPLLPRNSWAFYLGIGMCLLLAVLTWTKKKSVGPKMIIDQKIIKTTYGQTFNINSVTNVELIIKGKWSRYQSHYIKLFFANKRAEEFPVDGLDTNPQDILNVLKNKITKRSN